MDKESTRRHSASDTESKLETKLKQAKHEKDIAEEELETAKARWRAERRRLNGEMDKLEAALAEAKKGPRKRPSEEKKAPTVDPAVITKIQQEAEERFNKAAADWSAERARLKAEILRLEMAVAEALERSSNPLRATQSVRAQLESQIDRVVREKTDIDQAFLRAKTEWQQEKLKMTGELVKLRQTAQVMGKPIPRGNAPEVNPKVRDLQKQLKESLASWDSERMQMTAEIQKLQSSARAWERERSNLNEHAAQLQRAVIQAQASLQAQQEAAAHKGASLEGGIEEIQRQKGMIERQFETARTEWNTERQRLTTQIENLETDLRKVPATQDRATAEVVDQLRKQYDQKLQDAIQQKTQLAQELQRASELLEEERSRLGSEIAKSDSDVLSKDRILAEVARVETMIQEIVALIDNPETELATVIRLNVEKAELDAYLKGIRFLLGREAKA